MTNAAEEVMAALTEFKCGDVVTLHGEEGTIIRKYDPFYYMVEVYVRGCYEQRLWHVYDLLHADFGVI